MRFFMPSRSCCFHEPNVMRARLDLTGVSRCFGRFVFDLPRVPLHTRLDEVLVVPCHGLCGLLREPRLSGAARKTSGSARSGQLQQASRSTHASTRVPKRKDWQSNPKSLIARPMLAAILPRIRKAPHAWRRRATSIGNAEAAVVNDCALMIGARRRFSSEARTTWSAPAKSPAHVRFVEAHREPSSRVRHGRRRVGSTRTRGCIVC